MAAPSMFATNNSSSGDIKAGKTDRRTVLFRALSTFATASISSCLIGRLTLIYDFIISTPGCLSRARETPASCHCRRQVGFSDRSHFFLIHKADLAVAPGKSVTGPITTLTPASKKKCDHTMARRTPGNTPPCCRGLQLALAGYNPELPLMGRRWVRPFDYLPKPATVEKAGVKDCAVWPASPPRKYLYVDDELVTHPLATVLMSKSWEGAPPVYICTGWEILGPEDKFFAKKLAADGVPVVLEEYEAMPHCFAAILTKTPGARRCFDGWAGFIRAAVSDPESAPESRAVVVEAKTLKETRVEFESLSTVSEEEIQARILAKAGLTPIASQALPKL
uniref:Alpha/beta hydrolase fold-3 domain-containing protein n=1 Tax=Bionectria ochroleuca TaxID=29856 RepID=A0A8H7N852_BIOOC